MREVKLKVVEFLSGDKEGWPVKNNLYIKLLDDSVVTIEEAGWEWSPTDCLYYVTLGEEVDYIYLMVSIGEERIPGSSLDISISMDTSNFLLRTFSSSLEIEINLRTGSILLDPLVCSNASLVIKYSRLSFDKSYREDFSLVTDNSVALFLNWLKYEMIVTPKPTDAATSGMSITMYKARVSSDTGEEPRIYNSHKVKFGKRIHYGTEKCDINKIDLNKFPALYMTDVPYVPDSEEFEEEED